MRPSPSIVYLVDSDSPTRDAIRNLLQSVGLSVQVFASAEEFLATGRADLPSCLVSEVMLPGLRGLELQGLLEKDRISIPIIFISAHGDVPMVAKAMKAGAIDFLAKPISRDALLVAIDHGLAIDDKKRSQKAELVSLRSRHAQLSSREREVMDLVATGITNRAIGMKLGITDPTVKIHRREAMKKMQATSLADLVRMSDKLKL